MMKKFVAAVLCALFAQAAAQVEDSDSTSTDSTSFQWDVKLPLIPISLVDLLLTRLENTPVPGIVDDTTNSAAQLTKHFMRHI